MSDRTKAIRADFIGSAKTHHGMSIHPSTFTAVFNRLRDPALKLKQGGGFHFDETKINILKDGKDRSKDLCEAFKTWLRAEGAAKYDITIEGAEVPMDTGSMQQTEDGGVATDAISAKAIADAVVKAAETAKSVASETFKEQGNAKIQEIQQQSKAEVDRIEKAADEKIKTIAKENEEAMKKALEKGKVEMAATNEVAIQKALEKGKMEMAATFKEEKEGLLNRVQFLEQKIDSVTASKEEITSEQYKADIDRLTKLVSELTAKYNEKDSGNSSEITATAALQGNASGDTQKETGPAKVGSIPAPQTDNSSTGAAKDGPISTPPTEDKPKKLTGPQEPVFGRGVAPQANISRKRQREDEINTETGEGNLTAPRRKVEPYSITSLPYDIMRNVAIAVVGTKPVYDMEDKITNFILNKKPRDGDQ